VDDDDDDDDDGGGAVAAMLLVEGRGDGSCVVVTVETTKVTSATRLRRGGAAVSVTENGRDPWGGHSIETRSGGFLDHTLLDNACADGLT
jgi:hypothetical protein